MTIDEVRRAIEVGIEVAREFASSGVALIGIGEMGIANSTSAAAVISAVTGIPPARLAGRGTGLDDAGWKHKIDVVERAIALHRNVFGDGLGVLAAVGGYEIAAMAGCASVARPRTSRSSSMALSQRRPRRLRIRFRPDSSSICFSVIAPPKEGIAKRSKAFARDQSWI